MSLLLEGQGVLITGATGTFGRAFIPACLEHGAARVVALGRHEKEMAELEAMFGKWSQMRFYLGDVRDERRLELALGGGETPISIVVHAAALKRIEQCERDPLEAIATNISGSANVVSACLRSGSVKRCILLSTDKAVHPINLYGATKFAAERLFLAANNMAGGRCLFGVVRYGNIFGSRGSVVCQWQEAIAKGRPIRVTDNDVTRYFMRPDGAVILVLQGLLKTLPFLDIPTLPAYRLGDLMHAFGDPPHSVIRLPAWEKFHETLDGCTFSNEARRLTVEELRVEIARL